MSCGAFRKSLLGCRAPNFSAGSVDSKLNWLKVIALSLAQLRRSELGQGPRISAMGTALPEPMQKDCKETDSSPKLICAQKIISHFDCAN